MTAEQRSKSLKRWKPSGTRGVPFAPWMTFSSKSPFSYDNWGKDIQRPFQLILFPGYTVPKFPFEEKDCDFIFYEKPVEKSTIVWDGFDALALFEVAYEAFHLHGQEKFFGVRDVERKCWVADGRSFALLSTRPEKLLSSCDPITDPYRYQRLVRDHRRSLAKWAYECMRTMSKRSMEGGKCADSYRTESEAWSATNMLYSGVFMPDDWIHIDGERRETLAFKRESDPSVAFFNDTPYRSALTFRDDDITRKARQVFRPSSKAHQVRSQQRLEEIRTMTPNPIPADREKTSFWGNLFG